VPDEAELLVVLVPGQDEGHLIADVGGPLVREDPQYGGAFLQALRHEEVHEDFLSDVSGSVDRGVRAERDAAEHEVVQARDAGLHLLLLHLDLEVLLAGLDVLFDEALLPHPEFLHLLLEGFLLRPDLFFLLVDLPLQLFEARLHVELIRRAALRLRLLDLPSRGRPAPSPGAPPRLAVSAPRSARSLHPDGLPQSALPLRVAVTRAARGPPLAFFSPAGRVSASRSRLRFVFSASRSRIGAWMLRSRSPHGVFVLSRVYFSRPETYLISDSASYCYCCSSCTYYCRDR